MKEFEFKGFKLRCEERDSGLWFIAKDVCDILGIANARNAYSRLLDDEQTTVRLTDVGSNYVHPQKLVSESGLYSLIMGSRKKEAVEFQRWVTKEVLPSIRKNGGYVLDQEYLTPEQQELIIEKLVSLTKKVKSLKEKNAFLQKRRHELIAEKKDLKASKKESKLLIKKLNKNIDLLNKDANDSFNILDRALEDLEAANNKVRLLKDFIKKQDIPVPAPAPVVDNGPVYTVDKYGMVHFI